MGFDCWYCTISMSSLQQCRNNIQVALCDKCAHDSMFLLVFPNILLATNPNYFKFSTCVHLTDTSHIRNPDKQRSTYRWYMSVVHFWNQAERLRERERERERERLPVIKLIVNILSNESARYIVNPIQQDNLSYHEWCMHTDKP